MKTIFTALVLGVTLAAIAPKARAQEPGTGAVTRQEKTVSLELRDAPIRQGLEQLFKAWGVGYVIEQNVTGFVNLKLTDQPAENALKLLLRANTIPLTYSRENGAIIVRVRPVLSQNVPPPPPINMSGPAPASPDQGSGTILDVIPLLHTDPLDLAGVLGVIEIPFGTRYGNPTPGGSGAAGGTPPGTPEGNVGTGNPPLNPFGYIILGTQDNRLIVVKP